MSGQKPDYILKALKKGTDEKDVVGAAWVHAENGSISIALSPFVTLQGSKDLVLTLFINDKKKG